MKFSEPIAITGIGGIFPGAPDLETFWKNINEGKSSSRRIPDDRWAISPERVYSSCGVRNDKVVSLRCCYLEDFTREDLESLTHWGIPLEFLESLDPLFHLSLLAGIRAFSDAKLQEPCLEKTGVILGNIALPTAGASRISMEILGRTFEEKLLSTTRPWKELEAGALNRYVTGLPAGLLAKVLKLGGGTFTLDAACASSLYAVKLACDELLSGRADAMLTGGLCRPDSLYTNMGFTQLNALSPTGICSPFDVAGNGLVVGEGAGILVLRRLSDALEAGDRIYGLIRGIGLSNDQSGNLLAPDSGGQVRSMEVPYGELGWSPSDIDLVECHATGTPMGDAMEFKSLVKLFDSCRWEKGQCVIGSVKSNIGHLLTGAGAAGIIKVLLSLQNETLPPTANFSTPASGIRLAESAFRVLRSSEPWKRRSESVSRKAAVSAFGFGGINAHVLLEEYMPGLDYSSASVKRTFEVSSLRLKDGDGGQAGKAGVEPVPVAVIGMDVSVGPWKSFGEFYTDNYLNGFGDGNRGGEHDVKSLGGNGSKVEASQLSKMPFNWFGVENSSWFRNWLGKELDSSGYSLDTVSVPLGRFRIPPKELEEMLPQQLIMLHSASLALEQSGYQKADHLRSGIFIGINLDMNTTNFHVRWVLENKAREWAEKLSLDLSDEEFDTWVTRLRDTFCPPLNANRTMGALGSIVASRIAREYRFGGPSFALSSEDSSGLRALGVAVRQLQNGDVDLAVAGGVDEAGDIRSLICSWDSEFGTTSIFDINSTNTIPLFAEGAAAFVLKRLEDAERDGDRILGVIRGIGTACGGDPTEAMPSSSAFEASARRALSDADCSPDSISLIELGEQVTGRQVSQGVAALEKIFAGSSYESPVMLSCKSLSFGFSGAAGSLVSLAGLLASLRDERVSASGPGMILDRYISASSRFVIPSSPQYWLYNRVDGLRRSLIQSGSVDGNAVHVVVEEYGGVSAGEVDSSTLTGLRESMVYSNLREGIFPVEGNSPGSLRSMLSDLLRFIDSSDSSDIRSDIHSLAESWYFQNSPNGDAEKALVIVASQRDDLVRKIEVLQNHLSDSPQEALSGEIFCSTWGKVSGIYYNPDPLGREGKSAFVFPGSGTHYPGMGREICLTWPHVVRKQLMENNCLRDQVRPDLFWNDVSLQTLNSDHIALLNGHVTYGTIMYDLLRSFGIQPEGILSYSLGETTGLFATRAWKDRDSTLWRMKDSSLFSRDLCGEYRAAKTYWNLPDDATVDWCVGSIDVPGDRVREVLENREKVYLLIVNTPKECVIGGERREVYQLVEDLGSSFIPIEGVTSVHCEVVNAVSEAYRELHLLPVESPVGIEFYSCASGKSYEVTRENAASSIHDQAVRCFDFTEVIRNAYRDGFRTFIEIGPGSTCTRMIGRILEGRKFAARSASIPGMSEVSSVLHLLAYLISERISVDLSGLYGKPDTGKTTLPTTEKHGKSSAAVVIPVGGRPFDLSGLVDDFISRREVLTSSPGSVEKLVSDCVRPEQVSPVCVKPEALVSSGVDDIQLYEDLQLNNEYPVDTSSVDTSSVDTSSLDALVRNIVSAQQARGEAHERYLKLSNSIAESMTEIIQLQLQLLASPGAADIVHSEVFTGSSASFGEVSFGNQVLTVETDPAKVSVCDAVSSGVSAFSPLTVQTDVNCGKRVFMNREQCMEFAVGSIAAVLGEAYSEIDNHPTRVRLPDEPLMLVDRIVDVEGEALSMDCGRVITEHDIHPGAWYLDGGRIPTCIAVEAGQADLFLSGYLGIDFKSRGLAVYRLLDAVVTFHRPLPVPGDTIRYDIHIDHFFRQGDTYLFRFNFESTVNGEKLLTMKNGCAGFFTAEELDAGRGIIHTELDKKPMPGRIPPDWNYPVPMKVEAFSDAQLDHLRSGALHLCFGSQFENVPVARPLTLPGGRMNLVHRVLHLDPDGGRYSLGIIRGEADIHPDDWFLTCHFCDDNVMPGTLMYECCLHTLRVFLLRMGWISEDDGTSVWEPIPGVVSSLKCRGQVTACTKKAAYEISIKELGYGPEPYAIADALMYADGKPVVEMLNMSLRLTGASKESIEKIWKQQKEAERTGSPGTHELKLALYDFERILAFAVGKPSDAFGEPYRVFDEGPRVIARLPGPPFQVLDRITEIHAEAWKMASGGTIEAQYEIPTDAWYFEENRQRYMPFAILLEIALQPCGWFAAYMGSALTSEKDLSFRNLGGSAVLYSPVSDSTGVLTIRVKCTSVSSSGGMIIQNFDFEVLNGGETMYKGDTYFGFFSKEALRNQVGIRDAKIYIPSEEEIRRGRKYEYPMDPPFPGAQLRMVDSIDLFVPDGGPQGLGYIRGSFRVDPESWFFKAHFYQDPVCPGSLGLESFLQLLRAAAVERWGCAGDAVPLGVIPGYRHTWVYRGQVIPSDTLVTIEAWITSIDDLHQVMIADGFLSVDGRVIYQLNDFSLRMWKQA